MYANLLANALDINTKDDAHPSFVEIIKQLSPGEASLLTFLSENEYYPYVCSGKSIQTLRNKSFGFIGSRTETRKIKNEFLSFCAEFKDIMDVKSALDNYRRLQILDIESNMVQERNRGLDSTVITHTEKLSFTSFGIKFIQICVKNKT